jgi:hypothetical protein
VIGTAISTGIGSAEEMNAMYEENATETETVIETETEIAINPEEEQHFSATEQMDTAGKIS